MLFFDFCFRLILCLRNNKLKVIISHQRICRKVTFSVVSVILSVCLQEGSDVTTTDLFKLFRYVTTRGPFMAPPTPKYIQICCFGEADSWPSTKRPFYLSCAKTSVFGTTAVKLTATQMYFTLNFQPTEATFVFLFVLKRLNVKQVSTRECIPVECVPPAPIAVRGSPPGTPQTQTPQTRPPGTRYPPDQTLQDQAPPGTRHPPPRPDPLGPGTPWTRPPWDQAPPGPGTSRDQAPLLWTDTHL